MLKKYSLQIVHSNIWKTVSGNRRKAYVKLKYCGIIDHGITKG